MDEIEEVKVYRFEGTIDQDWVGSDDAGHWGVFIKGGGSDDLVKDCYNQMNQDKELDRYQKARVRVTIEVID